PDEVRIFEDGTLIASHPVLEGKNQRRVDPAHRKAPPVQTLPSTPVTCVARRPLDFYDAVGRRLAGQRTVS
ncbi:MAG: IS21 family transposase, partial [Hyphomicrobiales bacterium]|nr:IS21 family transposase [Hyphomicrobiales bacterium]